MKVWGDDPKRGSRKAGDGDPNRPDAPVAPVPAAVGDEPARHPHGSEVHAHLQAHPHKRGSASMPSVGIVGAGPVGLALGVAISRSGWPVAAVSSRDEDRRERFRSLVPGARVFVDPLAVVDEAELVILAIPDDAIPVVAASVRLYSGQVLIHTSGLLGAEVLEPARSAGSQIGAFHPMVSFTADMEAAVEALHGSTIALDGDDRALGLLADLAEAVGGVPVRLPPGSKPAYHAAAVLASGGLIALLDAVVALGAVAGLDERGSLAVYGRLMEGTLANARKSGVRAALTGPITRGDAGTLRAHLDALDRFAPDVVALYLAAAEREIKLADERGALTPDELARVLAALAKTA